MSRLPWPALLAGQQRHQGLSFGWQPRRGAAAPSPAGSFPQVPPGAQHPQLHSCNPAVWRPTGLRLPGSCQCSSSGTRVPPSHALCRGPRQTCLQGREPWEERAGTTEVEATACWAGQALKFPASTLRGCQSRPVERASVEKGTDLGTHPRHRPGHLKKYFDLPKPEPTTSRQYDITIGAVVILRLNEIPCVLDAAVSSRSGALPAEVDDGAGPTRLRQLLHRVPKHLHIITVPSTLPD